MRILLLNQAFYPDVVATAQHAADAARALAAEGHEVVVVCGRRAYDSPASSYPPRENWEGVTIRRIWSTGFGKAAKWRRAVDFASFLLSCFVRLCTVGRFDRIVALTSPPLISFARPAVCPLDWLAAGAVADGRQPGRSGRGRLAAARLATGAISVLVPAPQPARRGAHRGAGSFHARPDPAERRCPRIAWP